MARQSMAATKLSPGEINRLAKGIISDKPSSIETDDIGDLSSIGIDGAENGVTVTSHSKSVAGRDPGDIKKPRSHLFTKHEPAMEHVSGLMKKFFKGKK